MNERLTPDTQQHLQVLQRYMLAMESGDIDSMAIVLCEAEQDRALENMILEVNDFYQLEDHTIAEPADVMLVKQRLLNTIPAMRENEPSVRTSAQSSDSNVNPVYTQTQGMLETVSEPENAPDTIHQQTSTRSQTKKAPTQVLPSRKIAPQKWYQTRRNWLLAAIAAVLVALLLLPNSGALANQLLSLFRVQQFQPVPVFSRCR